MCIKHRLYNQDLKRETKKIRRVIRIGFNRHNLCFGNAAFLYTFMYKRSRIELLKLPSNITQAGLSQHKGPHPFLGISFPLLHTEESTHLL